MNKPQLINEEEFSKLTAAQKRVELAKDVITRIDLGMVVPTVGQFWTNRGSAYLDRSENENITPKGWINDNPCEVCAKGAIFCTWVGNFNKVTWGEVSINENLRRSTYPSELLEVFGRQELDNLEAAFEGRSYGWHYDAFETNKFAREFVGINSLRELMHNIVMNEGTLTIPE